MGFYEDVRKDALTASQLSQKIKSENSLAVRDRISGAHKILLESQYEAIAIYAEIAEYTDVYRHDGYGWLTTINMDGGWVAIAISTDGRCAYATYSTPEARERSARSTYPKYFQGVPDDVIVICAAPLTSPSHLHTDVLDRDFSHTFELVASGRLQSTPGLVN